MHQQDFLKENVWLRLVVGTTVTLVVALMVSLVPIVPPAARSFALGISGSMTASLLVFFLFTVITEERLVDRIVRDASHRATREVLSHLNHVPSVVYRRSAASDPV